MISKIKRIGLSLVLIAGVSCSNEFEQEIATNNNQEFELNGEAKFGAPTGYSTGAYFSKPSGLPTKNFTGTTSAQLQTLINNNSSGAIIKIPKKAGGYNWGEVKLKSKIQLEIEKGTVIRPSSNSVRRIFSIGTSGNGARVNDVSIVGIGGKFIIELNKTEFLNKNIAFVKMGRTTNFKIFNVIIKERRTSLASILLNYVKSSSDNEPYPKNGLIGNINQTGISHTGYGLIQGYSASNVLFKNLNCKGGVTLRFETDDKTMKDAVKGGGKTYGMKDIYADNIKCTAGLCPLMLSPHFAQNGKINARKITATGCAFAVRVEHGFVEVFDTNKTYALTAAGGNQFKNFIANKISGTGSSNKFVGNQYKRANGTQWAIRLSDASVNGTLDSYITNQIGTLKNGKFANTTINTVKAVYKPTNAKLKQSFLKYIPCGDWSSKLKRPTDTGMGNGFEYYGPSMGIRFDNTNGSASNGNYIITVNGTATGFSTVRNILYNTSTACSTTAYGSIPQTTTPGL